MNMLSLLLKNIHRLTATYFFLLGTACASSSSDLQILINDSLSDKAQAAQRAQLRKVIKWPDNCEETFNYPTAGFTFFKQNKDQYVAQITCTYGSYQGMSLFYKIDISTSIPSVMKIDFSTYNSEKKPMTELWGNVLTSSTVKQFKILNLYSGFGHCGSLTTYDLTTKKPSISRLKAQSNCETKVKIRDPEKWKTIKFQ